MSGIIGSRLNTRGSGLTGSLGTDGQVLTSAGAGLSAVHENVAVTSGKVLQLISDTTTTEQSTSSTSWVDGDLSVTITPASSSNKVVCMLSTTTRIWDQTVDCGLGIDRSGGASGDGQLGGQTWGLARNHYASFNDNDNSREDDNPAAITYLDSPGVASAVTYKFQFKAATGTCYVQTGSTTSSLVVMEIGA